MRSLWNDQLARGLQPSNSVHTDSFSHVNGSAGDDLINMHGVNDPLLISGLGGDDTLSGGNAGDILKGGAGNDILHAGIGEGNDTLYGGVGNDIFMFGQPDSWGAYTKDRIADLHKGDIIDLSGIDADPNTEGDQAFVIVDHFDGHAGELRIKYDAKHDTTKMIMDTSGSTFVSYSILADGDHHNFHDFVL